jgi:hypothetical protein
VPCQQGGRGHQAGESIQCFTPQPLAFDGQPPALAIIEPRLLAQQFFENTDFFLQIFNHVLLIAIHPTGRAEYLKRKWIHRHRMATPLAIRQRPWPSPNPLKIAANVVRFEYLDSMPSSSAHEVQKTMQRSVTNGKTADHGRSAMTAAQMLLEKPVGMA